MYVRIDHGKSRDGSHASHFDGKKDVPHIGAGDSYYRSSVLSSAAELAAVTRDLLHEVSFVQMYNLCRGGGGNKGAEKDGDDVEAKGSGSASASGMKSAVPIPRYVSAQCDAVDSAHYRMPGCNQGNIPKFPWTPTVARMRDIAREVTGLSGLNHCVITLYPDGNGSLAAHHDNLLDLTPGTGVVSMSFGAVRPMLFAEVKTSKTQTINLAPGSLLYIGKKTNSQFTHAIPKVADAVGFRISLTFRDIVARTASTCDTATVTNSEYTSEDYPFLPSHRDVHTPDMDLHHAAMVARLTQLRAMVAKGEEGEECEDCARTGPHVAPATAKTVLLEAPASLKDLQPGFVLDVAAVHVQPTEDAEEDVEVVILAVDGREATRWFVGGIRHSGEHMRLEVGHGVPGATSRFPLPCDGVVTVTTLPPTSIRAWLQCCKRTGCGDSGVVAVTQTTTPGPGQLVKELRLVVKTDVPDEYVGPEKYLYSTALVDLCVVMAGVEGWYGSSHLPCAAFAKKKLQGERGVFALEVGSLVGEWAEESGVRVGNAAPAIVKLCADGEPILGTDDEVKLVFVVGVEDNDGYKAENKGKHEPGTEGVEDNHADTAYGGYFDVAS
jgi:hypothetical protein